MHYSPNAYLRTGAEYTMRSRETSGRNPVAMGQRKGMSLGDIAWVNRAYGCPCHCHGDDLPGAQSYADWLRSRQERAEYDSPHFLVPDSDSFFERT